MKSNITTGLLMFFFTGLQVFCLAQQPDKAAQVTQPQLTVVLTSHDVYDSNSSQDSLIKARLVNLAINNPALREDDAKIKIARLTLIKAKNSWLGALNASGNVNEFVINNTVVNGVSAANYYPKYNFGVTVPFDIFSRTKNDSRIAEQNIDVAKAEREIQINAIKKDVLTLYENYKEKEQLFQLEKIITEGDNQAYIASQKSYSDGTIKVDEMNRAYQTSIITQTKLVSAERDYNVSRLELEEEIGISLEDAINQALNPGNLRK